MRASAASCAGRLGLEPVALGWPDARKHAESGRLGPTADTADHRIWRVSPAGTITTVAGTIHRLGARRRCQPRGTHAVLVQPANAAVEAPIAEERAGAVHGPADRATRGTAFSDRPFASLERMMRFTDSACA